jgi:threonine aldolase
METRTDDELRAACTRFLHWHGERSPADILAELAEHASADRYGAGGAVAEVERRTAELLGKPAALFLPSGTMAQQIALRILCERTGCFTVGFHPQCHLDVHEERGYEHLHGLHACLVGGRDRLIGRAELAEVKEPLGALLLELPQRDLGGRLPTWRELVSQTKWARARGVALHLDGARLWQCGPFYRRPLSDIAALFDTVYVSLYKDLGGLGGCLLAGDEDVVGEARVWRVRHGGRLASFEALALSGELGLDEILPRMPSFVRKAREIGRALARIDGVDVAPIHRRLRCCTSSSAATSSACATPRTRSRASGARSSRAGSRRRR